MKPHEETLEVSNCGNPEHGPMRQCWKVTNADGVRRLSGVYKATADRYAAFPEMARALIAMKARMEREGPEDTPDPIYDAICEALTKAGL
jgi:hypothetical protein